MEDLFGFGEPEGGWESAETSVDGSGRGGALAGHLRGSRESKLRAGASATWHYRAPSLEVVASPSEVGVRCIGASGRAGLDDDDEDRAGLYSLMVLRTRHGGADGKLKTKAGRRFGSSNTLVSADFLGVLRPEIR